MTFDITIGKSSPTITSLTEVACNSYRFNDSIVFNTSGVHIINLRNVSGCDSLIALDLIIEPGPETNVVETGGTLIAGAASSYQWYDCTEKAIIPGATSQNFTPTKLGSYAVILTGANNCTDTSDCYLISTTDGVSSIRDSEKQIEVYPNPVSRWVTIHAAWQLKDAQIRLISPSGQLLFESNNQKGYLFNIDMEGYAQGMYFIEVIDADRVYRIKVTKDF
jgi:hypothetical protein